MVSGWLLDTNVVSALHPDRDELPARAVAWIARREAESFISVVTIMEIEAGVAALRLSGASAKVERLQPWLDQLKDRFAESLLHIDLAVSETAGRLIAEARASGRRPDTADLLIAATARAADLAIVTRNVRHFEHLGVELINPFSI